MVKGMLNPIMLFKPTAVTVLLALIFGFVPNRLIAQSKTGKRLDAEAKGKITKTLAEHEANEVILFDPHGKSEGVVAKLTDDDVRRYGSLEQFLIDKNPVDSCKNPVPSPPCVICDDGRVVCSKAFSQKRRPPSLSGGHPSIR